MGAMTSDKIWKMSIENYFQEFMEFFAPDISRDIDFTKGFEDLNHELKKIVPESEAMHRECDSLLKVTLKDAGEKWVLLHLEIQGYEDDRFAERMFAYYYRIYDRYNQEIYPLAVFTHGIEDNQPKAYEKEFYGMKLCYQYPVYRVIEPKEQWLKEQDNPFAMAVLACQYALRSTNNLSLRVNFKRNLIDFLGEICQGRN